MLFRDFGALDAALEFGSLSAPLKQSLRETARPAIAFTRELRPEADIPIGASKLGGDPDLPPDFPWPWRGPYSDGESHAAKLRELAKKSPYPERDYVEADAIVRDFPLAFLCQINLDTLAKEPGFDRTLFPERGRLLVFVDTCFSPTGHDPADRSWLRLIWDETPVERLERREAPEILKKTGTTLVLWNESTWDDWSEAEMLKAVSGVSISMGESDVSTWQEALPDELVFFGSERLGGWCYSIQHSPVPSIVGAIHGLNAYERDLSAAEERALLGLASEWPEWQHVLTVPGEPDTYRTPINWGDGDLYIFMRREDLQARRFETARGVTQRDRSGLGRRSQQFPIFGNAIAQLIHSFESSWRRDTATIYF